MTTVLQAYQFALDPTEVQAAALRSHCGGAWFAFNWGLSQITAVMHQRSAERSYGLDEDQLTPVMNWSAYSLGKAFNAAKAEVAPWWAENSKEAYASGLANLADALGNWHKSRTGKRAGKRPERAHPWPWPQRVSRSSPTPAGSSAASVNSSAPRASPRARPTRRPSTSSGTGSRTCAPVESMSIVVSAVLLVSRDACRS